MISAPVLFLDYDGVLHPDEVYLDQSDKAFLVGPGELFMWAPLLAEILVPHPEVRIVLSTSWAAVYGWEQAAAFLPPAIESRVIGATLRSRSRDRCRAVQTYVAMNEIPHGRWLALDDENERGWTSEARENLIVCNPSTGLSDKGVQQVLAERLHALDGDSK